MLGAFEQPPARFMPLLTADSYYQIHELCEASIGVFFLRQNKLDHHEYFFRLVLNQYHSKCLRQWLDLRW